MTTTGNPYWNARHDVNGTSVFAALLHSNRTISLGPYFPYLTMYQAGKVYQVAKEMRSLELAILGVGEMGREASFNS